MRFVREGLPLGLGCGRFLVIVSPVFGIVYLGLILLMLLAAAATVFFVVFLVAYAWRMTRRRPETGWFYCAVQTFCLLAVRCFYRAQVQGAHHLPATGGVLIVCNHVSYLDPVLVGVFSSRPVRFLSWEGFERVPVMRRIMRLMGSIPVDESKAKDAIAKASEALKRGEVVCIFPEGHVTRNGHFMEIRRGFELIARRAGCPIAPLWIDGKWGSIFSFSGGRFFWKFPTSFRRSVRVVFGPAYPAEKSDETRQRLLELSADAFAGRPALQEHLASVVAKGLARKGGSPAIIDRTGERKSLSGAVSLAIAYLLAQRIRREVTTRRVAIVLPPGAGAALANLACVIADKVVVNLNFTLGRAQVESCLSRAECAATITASAFREKLHARFPDFPWSNQLIDIAEAIREIPRWKIVLMVALIRITPVSMLPGVLGLPDKGGEAEAALLFTSGSSGMPKGVPLTHANILANLIQIDEAGIVPRHARLLSSLPVFHSFGFTVGVWYGLSRNITLVCLPSPIDTVANIAAVREERVTITLGTPTFLRPWLKRATREDLATLEWAVAGAEKVPADLTEAFVNELGTGLIEGYGATEASPVLAVNVPDIIDALAPGGMWKGNTVGSVGRPVVGLAVRVLHPETLEVMPLDQIGLLEVRGANLFKGYLGDAAKTAEALRDGWYRTGDLARVDEHGFLHLSGRLSRFSKIGGEMVPHGTVEDAIIRVAGLAGGAEISIAVSACADVAKGEQLVVLHAVDLDVNRVREQLAADGLPNLWIPKSFCKVERIPVLGTGKLDLRAIKQLADESRQESR